MSFNLTIQNNTSGAIVADGNLINQGAHWSSQDSTVNIQIPFQAVLQVNYTGDNKALISSSFYKNEIEYNGEGITLSINQNFEFSVDGTPIQNVPLQTNRIANYPFQPLESTSLPKPWTTYPAYPELTVKSLNAQELNFSATQKSNVYGLAYLPNVKPNEGVQVSFKLQVDTFVTSNDSSNAIFLPESFKLSFNSEGEGAYYYNNKRLGGSSIRIGDGKQHDITIILFSSSYVLIEDGTVRINKVYEGSGFTITDIKFGCSTNTEVPSMNFTFSEIQMGTPQTLDVSEYAFSGMGNLWSDNYIYNSNYATTNWVCCDHVIASVQYDKNDSSNLQVITIVDMNTGEAITKETAYTGQANRSPFVDEEFKYICFPINNRYYYIYDLNKGDFTREDAIDLDPGTKYSEEVCYKGTIYFAGYDKNWHIYDIATGTKSTHGFNTDNPIKRIVRPIVCNGVIFAAMYTELNGTYTEIVASTINEDGSLSNKWHKPPHDSSNTQIWSNYISHDGSHLYYWDANIDLFAINLSDGSEAWISTDYTTKSNDVASNAFAPITDELGALYIITTSGKIISLSPETGKTKGNSDKPFNSKNYTIGESCLSASIDIYPNDVHSPSTLWSMPKIVNGHFTCQGNSSKALYSVNLDTGIIQSSILDSDCYVTNFSPNIMTSSYDKQGVNLIQMQQYDRNFYFDSALMAEDYERDAKSDTVRPKTTDNSFYAVTVSIQSNDGVPINNVVYIKNMGEQVTIISSLFEGDQGAVTLAPKEQVAIKPGFDGKFTFRIPATSLYCPALHFWSDFMLPNVRVAFFANQSNVDVLRNQTAEDVIQAKSYVGLDEDADQGYVFEDDFRNEDDADLITQMIANSVGGSILDEDAEVRSLSKKEFSVKSVSKKSQQRTEREEKIRRRAVVKQDVLSTATYTPNLTMDYCAFADDNTDNCLCTNDPTSPIIDQPYLANESTYASGEFVIVDDQLRGPSQNILYDADRDKTKWRKANQLFEEQINDYLVENPALLREDVEEDIYGFRAFVNECIKSDEQVQSFHWEPQDEGVRKGIKKVFHVVISAGKKVYRFIVNTMEQGLLVLESFFKQVAKSIIDVVQWLSWVLNWQDILNCQKNLSTCMSNNFKKGLDYFSFNQDKWISSVNSFVDRFEESVDEAFNTAESAIGGYNMDDITQEYKNPRTLTGEGGANVTNQMNYFNDQLGIPTNQAEYIRYKRSYLKYERIKRFEGNEVAYLENLHPKISRMIQLQEDSAGQNGLLDFFKAIGNEVDKYVHIFENLFTQLKGQINDDTFQAASDRASAIMYAFRTKVNTPKEFLQTCMVVLLDLLKSFIDLALEACRLLIIDLIRLIPEFIDSIITIMEKPINVPGITDLWNFIVGDDEDLTVLNFTSLLIALPMTLSMKMLGYDNNIFFRDGDNGIQPLEQGELVESDEKGIKIGTSVGAGIAALGYDACDFIVDTAVPPPPSATISILVFDISVVGLTFPTYTDPSSVYGGDYAAWTMGAVHWIMELVFTSIKIDSRPAETIYAVFFEVICFASFLGKLDHGDKYGSKDDNKFLLAHQTVYLIPEFFKPLKSTKDLYAILALGFIDLFFNTANAVMYWYYVKNA